MLAYADSIVSFWPDFCKSAGELSGIPCLRFAFVVTLFRIHLPESLFAALPLYCPNRGKRRSHGMIHVVVAVLAVAPDAVKVLYGIEIRCDLTHMCIPVEISRIGFFYPFNMPLMNYTIGQRRNVGLSGDQERHYVCGKDSKTNTLYIAYGSDSKYLLSDEALIEDVNFISDKHPTFATAKFRYRSEDIPVTIEYLENNQIRVKYVDGKAVTPGQACVIYLGEQCLMGGIIKQVFKDGKDIWYLK